MQENRTTNSLKNIKIAFVGQSFGIIISLISRFAFVKILSSDYLGLSSLFSNILSILSLAEMGVGTAIAYELYKPIANKEYEKIKSLMQYFKKIYTFIGILLIFLGLITIPIYPFLINEIPNISNLNLIYFLFVLNSAISYFMAYKRILLVSDQKKYIDTIYKYGFYFILNVIQIIILYFTKNFIFYLVAQILMTFIENVSISIKVNKLYPYLSEANYTPLDVSSKMSIKKNVKALFFHKFGGIVLNSTDNIVISKVIGLFAVGLYSNYFLVLSALDKVINQIFSSLIASIGNLDVTSTKSKKTMIFQKIFFINFCIYAFCIPCLLNLFNPFIELWLGKEFLLSNVTVIIIVVNVYIYGMRRTAMAFRESTGNYSLDWYSPIIEAVINIIISIIGAYFFGIAGVFLGTILSSLCTNFWLEPLVVCKKTLNITLGGYMKQHFKYSLIVLLCSVSSVLVTSFLSGNSIVIFVLKGFISLVIPAILVFLVFRKNENYIYIKNIILNNILKGNRCYNINNLK